VLELLVARGAVNAEDLLAVHQLLGWYGHLVDAQDWSALAELFTDDAEIDFTGASASGIYRGVGAIIEYFSTATHPSSHYVLNIVVQSIADDEATVVSKFLVPYTRPVHDPKRWGGGEYHDVVRKRDGHWRFARRAAVRTWQMVLSPHDEAHLPINRRTF
jgi:3-phenylpropionate/cinnamic acid dioxygenase small subunit